MQKKLIRLSISEEEIAELKSLNKKIIDHLEEGFSLKSSVLEDLKNLLSAIVANQPALVEILEAIELSGEYFQVQLLHDDNEILNLPWSYAVDPVSKKILGVIQELMISKCLPEFYHPQEDTKPTLSPPLKILIMISSPEDSDLKYRLSFEEEEMSILEAFQPLMKTGQVQIDFTNDGSLEELRRKIKTNTYHILHYSGHAVFKKGTGYLMLEKPHNLHTDKISATEFSKALNCNPRYKIPIVVLSSCQSAKGSNEEGLRGITNQLLKIGIPTVISMGMSIKDNFATYFSSTFYENIANKQYIAEAFHAAVNNLRDYEFQLLSKAGVTNPTPLQWIIPNLYCSTNIDFPVDWSKGEEKLSFSSFRFLFENNRLILEHDKNYLFIGRRKDKAKIMNALMEKRPVYIKGQGGVGKTALAEHLVQRIIANEPSAQPFVFNEKTKSIEDIQKPLTNYLEERNLLRLSELERHEKGIEQFKYLLNLIASACTPVFIFDNLESFQKKPDEGFDPAYTDIKEVIDSFSAVNRFFVILTGRYTIPGFEYAEELNLNQVGINDFWKKCHYLELGKLALMMAKKKSKDALSDTTETKPFSFSDIVHLLHKSLGGNYRALEFFNELFRQEPEKIEYSLKNLQTFQQTYQDKTEEVKGKMSQNLLFDQLLSLLTEDENKALRLLSFFNIPVQTFALQLQLGKNTKDEAFMDLLVKLYDLTLIEVSVDMEIETSFYYVTTLIKDLIDRGEPIKQKIAFSHQNAGKYYYYNSTNLTHSVTELEEAFYHFCLATDNLKILELGDRLSGLYYNLSIYQSADYYASTTRRLLRDNISYSLRNRSGLISLRFGNYQDALGHFEIALKLNQEIGDKSGEGTTLNNISQIYDARGDYETALKYLERSLSISQEIGDKSGMIPTLHNMSSIAFEKKDTAKGIEYCTAAYQLANETNNAMGLFHVGQMYGEILIENGMKQEGISVLKNAYFIGQQAGFPGLEELASMIQELENN